MSTEVTIFDVAKAAGVSISSVSRVINGKAERYRIGSSAQARVLTAVRQLGYQPDTIARNVALGKGVPPRSAAPVTPFCGISDGRSEVKNVEQDRRQIGLFISATSPASTLAFIPGVEPVIAEAGYELVVVTVSSDPAAAWKRVGQFLGDKTAGMLCCPSLYSAVLATVNGKCPVMVLWQGAGNAMLKAVRAPQVDAPAVHSGQAEEIPETVTPDVAPAPPLESTPVEGGASSPPAPESITPVTEPDVTSPPIFEPVVEPPPPVEPVPPPEVIPATTEQPHNQ